MDPILRIQPDGSLAAESPEASLFLARHAGRYRLVPTSHDLLIGVGATLPGRSSPESRVILAGDASGIPLVDLIGFLNQSRASGLLHVNSPTGTRSLAFIAGEVRGASSTNVSERFGETAVRLGYLRREQLDALLARRQERSRLGRVMVTEGLLQPHDLYVCIRQQVTDIFQAILLTVEGTFTLTNQSLDAQRAISLNTQSLLMESLRQLDEMREFRKRIPSLEVHPCPLKPADGELAPHERRVFDLCDGARSLAEVARGARMTEFDATKVAHQLIERGYLAMAVPGIPDPVRSLPTLEAIVRAFNQVFQRIFEAVARSPRPGDLLATANGALINQSAVSPIFRGLSFAPEGHLSGPGLLDNLSRLSSSPEEGARLLHNSLTELMYFLLFETSERLDPGADQILSRDIEALLAPIAIEPP